MSNDRKIAKHLSLIQAALQQFFPSELSQDFCLQQTGQIGSYDYAHLTLSEEPLRYLLSFGGKRWRPLALTLCAEALGADITQAAALSCVVEFSHNGSLMVDDIEDASLLRRGQPAAHVVYGQDYTINSANYAYFLGTVALEAWQGPTETKLLMFQAWAKALRALHMGQALDIAWHREENFWPTIDQYITMCRLKTGSLSALSGCLVGLLAGISPEQTQALSNCWQEVGVGFQILDDVKNLTTGMPGKQHADDLIEGKKSLPLILAALQGPQVAQRITDFLKNIKQLTGLKQQEQMQQALDFLHKLDVLQPAKQHGLAFLQNARTTLQTLLPSNEASKAAEQFLVGLMEMMI